MHFSMRGSQFECDKQKDRNSAKRRCSSGPDSGLTGQHVYEVMQFIVNDDDDDVDDDDDDDGDDDDDDGGRSVGPSVRRSVHPSVTHELELLNNAIFQQDFVQI